MERGLILLSVSCYCLAIPSMLTAERKCPHDGACEIDAARTGKTSGTQQLTGWIYDDGAGSDTDGTERTPYQARGSALSTANAVPIGLHTATGTAPARGIPGSARWNFAYREKGAAAIAHGNRGRSPANATPSTLAIEAVRLARTRYAGVNHTHLSELLREREGIDIGRDTLRRILTNAGVNSPRRRRPPKHRVRRQRMPGT